MNTVIMNGEITDKKIAYTYKDKTYYSGKIINFPVIIREDHLKEGMSLTGELRSHMENGECKMYIYGKRIEDIEKEKTGITIRGRIYKKRYVAENVAVFTICALRENKKRIDLIYGVAYDQEAKNLMEYRLKTEFIFQGQLRIKRMKNQKDICEFIIKKHIKS